MCVLGACSAALSHEFRLKVMRHGTWWGSPGLWIMPCGDASKKKTPIFDKVLEEIASMRPAPLKKYDEAKEEVEAALEAFDKKEGKPKPNHLPSRDATSPATSRSKSWAKSSPDRGAG